MLPAGASYLSVAEIKQPKTRKSRLALTKNMLPVFFVISVNNFTLLLFPFLILLFATPIVKTPKKASAVITSYLFIYSKKKFSPIFS